MNTSENFQSRSSRTGKVFECWVRENIKGYGPLLETNCWKGDNLVEVDAEFKGAYVFAKGGEADRPGLYRTDNTKKCIADVIMLKSLISEGLIPNKAIIVATTARPKKGERTSRNSQASFLASIVDKIVVKDEDR